MSTRFTLHLLVMAIAVNCGIGVLPVTAANFKWKGSVKWTPTGLEEKTFERPGIIEDAATEEVAQVRAEQEFRKVLAEYLKRLDVKSIAYVVKYDTMVVAVQRIEPVEVPGPLAPGLPNVELRLVGLQCLQPTDTAAGTGLRLFPLEDEIRIRIIESETESWQPSHSSEWPDVISDKFLWRGTIAPGGSKTVEATVYDVDDWDVLERIGAVRVVIDHDGESVKTSWEPVADAEQAEKLIDQSRGRIPSALRNYARFHLSGSDGGYELVLQVFDPAVDTAARMAELLRKQREKTVAVTTKFVMDRRQNGESFEDTWLRLATATDTMYRVLWPTIIRDVQFQEDAHEALKRIEKEGYIGVLRRLCDENEPEIECLENISEKYKKLVPTDPAARGSILEGLQKFPGRLKRGR